MKQQKTYVLTPSRKHMGKAVARKSSMKLATECLQNASVCKYIIQRIGRMARTELKQLCLAKQSILRSTSIDDIKHFKWEMLFEELKTSAPIFCSLLSSFTTTRKPRNNQQPLICICGAIILKYRFKQMSLVHKIIGLILYAGHSSKKVST